LQKKATIFKHFLIWSFVIIILHPIAVANTVGVNIDFNRVQLTLTNVSNEGINTVIVPFEIVDGLIIVKAKIDKGEEENFIIDTGAKGLVLNSKYYTSLINSNVQALGLNGNASDVGERTIDTMLLDELNFTQIIADVIDLKNIELKKKLKINGLIGYDLLKDFEVMLNYNKRYITLSRIDANGNILDPMPQTQNKIDSFTLELANFVPLVEIKINKIPKKMIIDTGSEFNLLNSKKNDDIIGNFTPTKRINIAGSEGKNIDAIGGKLYRLSIGDRYKCGALSTVIMDLKSLSKLYNSKLDGILGFEFLSPWVMSINYKKKLLYIHEIKFERP
jgi:hypothetical protein